LQFQHARVFALFHVKKQEASPGDHAHVNDNTNSIGGFKLKINIQAAKQSIHRIPVQPAA
jgi:hypothetical protein